MWIKQGTHTLTARPREDANNLDADRGGQMRNGNDSLAPCSNGGSVFMGIGGDEERKDEEEIGHSSRFFPSLSRCLQIG